MTRAGSVRTCIATGEEGPPSSLVRFALSPDGVLTPDLGRKLPGRGAWTAARREAVEKAAKKGLFARAMKASVRLPEGLDPAGLAEAVADGLEARVLSAIGLARRSGDLVMGGERLAPALEAGRLAFVWSAIDAGASGTETLSRRAAAGGVPRARGATSAALSAALGANGVRHIGAPPGRAAARVLEEARRLHGFRPVFVDPPRTDLKHADGRAPEQT